MMQAVRTMIQAVKAVIPLREKAEIAADGPRSRMMEPVRGEGYEPVSLQRQSQSINALPTRISNVSLTYRIACRIEYLLKNGRQHVRDYLYRGLNASAHGSHFRCFYRLGLFIIFKIQATRKY